MSIINGIRFIPEKTALDFTGFRHIAFALSALLVIGSLALAGSKGLNFGIDFTGGTVIEIAVEKEPDLGDLRGVLAGLDLGAISIQEFGEPTNLLIRLPQQEDGTPEDRQAAIGAVRAALAAHFGEEAVAYRRVEFVGPQVGEELKKAGVMAMLFSLAGILVYIWFRFEWQFGVASVVALAHDAIATIGLFALTQMEFNLSTVAALLMIAGYSINDTVVVFDRIRENLRKYKKMPLFEILNLSVNQTLSRTVMTSVTTMLALLALAAFGGEVIRGFVNALIFGIVIGTYSSIFIAAPVLIYLNIRRDAPELTDPADADTSAA